MQVKKDEIRNKIIEIAKEAFINNSFDKLSMRKLAEKVGITVGNLYHYFKSKEDLYYYLLIEQQEERISKMLKEVETGKNGLEKLYLYGKSYFNYVLKYPEELQKILNWFINGTPSGKISDENMISIRNKRSNIFQHFKSIFEEGIKDGSIRDDIEIGTTIKYFTMCLRILLYDVAVLKNENEETFETYLKILISSIKK